MGKMVASMLAVGRSKGGNEKLKRGRKRCRSKKERPQEDKRRSTPEEKGNSDRQGGSRVGLLRGSGS